MRIRKKDQNNLLKVGIFLAGLFFVLMVMVISIGKVNSIFASKVDIKAHVENVSNLKEGSYVELKGIRVGAVSDIRIISEEEVEVTATIQEDQLQWIKKDSKVSISSAGLVGDKYLEVYSGKKDSPVFNPKTDILTSENTADFKQIMTKGESIATITERILSRLDQILFNMDEGKKLVEIVNSMNKTSSNLEVITKDLKEAQLGQVAKNINLSMAKLSKASVSMERIMSRIEEGPGTMNSLIYDDGLHDDLRSLLGGASRNKVIKYFIRESIKNSEQKKEK